MYKISYVGDGETSEFSFSFPFFQESDVKVSIDNTVLDTTQYAVNPNDDFGGGIVVFASAPENNKNIDIFRQVDLSRVIDYQTTAKIDPEDLNTDFNFLLAALQDIRSIDVDLAQWANVHDNLLTKIDYAISTIEDKMSGGAVLGLYYNLVSVLQDMINDYGSVAEDADGENNDDYGSI
ncbi:MAG: hypothetical protein IKF41_02810 [Alphaproteobacteria bacterium]|nr:hypothetical protein [Alphaproteobacteria bacterium]